MNSKPLGRLQKVELREAWLSESSDFTPWLAQPENLKLLGEAIGIELECESQEKDVGPFRADILCKDDSWVLIENQLERTDHSTFVCRIMTRTIKKTGRDSISFWRRKRWSFTG